MISQNFENENTATTNTLHASTYAISFLYDYIPLSLPSNETRFTKL